MRLCGVASGDYRAGMPRIVVLILAATVFGIIADAGLGMDYDTIRALAIVGVAFIGSFLAARSTVKWIK